MSQWEGWHPWLSHMENKIHVPNHQPVSISIEFMGHFSYQWEGLSHILWKIKFMFKTTNQPVAVLVDHKSSQWHEVLWSSVFIDHFLYASARVLAWHTRTTYEVHGAFTSPPRIDAFRWHDGSCLAGGWFQPLWKILISWDDYSIYYRKIKNVPNHQPASGCWWISEFSDFSNPWIYPHEKFPSFFPPWDPHRLSKIADVQPHNILAVK